MTQVGFCLQAKRHAEMIVTGDKTIVISAERFYRYVRIPIYLFGDYQDQTLRCYGKIVLGSPKAITLAEFGGLRSEHRITENERKERWPDNLNLYAYEIQVLETYDPPKRVKFPPRTETQTWLRSWKWLDPPPKELHIEKIRDLSLYNPAKVPQTRQGNAILRDDMRILAAWWSSKRQGKESPYSLELIEEKYCAVLKELIAREAATFHPSSYKQHVRELFDKAKRALEDEGIVVPVSKGFTGNLDNLDRELYKAQPRLVPFVIIDSYISHTGSAVYGLREPHDCDLVIRDEENPKVTQALLRVVGLPSSKIHRVYDRRGPAFDYVPLLDLMAVPVNWKGPWPKRETRHEGIPERSWDLYRAFPPAALVEDPYVTLDGTSVFIREAGRSSGVELKLRRLFGEISQTFSWVGPEKTMKGKSLFRSYLTPHVPLVKMEINEPLFRRYY